MLYRKSTEFWRVHLHRKSTCNIPHAQQSTLNNFKVGGHLVVFRDILCVGICCYYYFQHHHQRSYLLIIYLSSSSPSSPSSSSLFYFILFIYYYYQCHCCCFRFCHRDYHYQFSRYYLYDLILYLSLRSLCDIYR